MPNELLAILLGACLILAGCGSALAPLRSAWNASNDGAKEVIAQITREHKADVAATLGEPNALAAVRLKWRPVYRRYRVLRAALASARVLLDAPAEDLSAAKIEVLTDDLLAAGLAVKAALP